MARCIYVVEDEPNICKIGFTTQDPPDKRVNQLTCKHHKDFIIRGCVGSENVIG